jgi:hypothetical protein
MWISIKIYTKYELNKLHSLTQTAFKRFLKIARSDYYLHVRLSVRMERHGSHRTDFDET